MGDVEKIISKKMTKKGADIASDSKKNPIFALANCPAFLSEGLSCYVSGNYIDIIIK